MSPGRTANKPEPNPQQRLRRYLWLSRTAYAFAIGAFLAAMLGVLCLPKGAVVNPEATGSFFVAAGASGWFWADSRNLFAIGGSLAVIAIGLWAAVRAAFRPRRSDDVA
jgi:hypothetical protein